MVADWSGRRAQAALRQVRARGMREKLPCCLCGKAIDYRLRRPNEMACSVQHKIPRSLRPDLTWDPSNWAPAHLLCNWKAGKKLPEPELGEEDMWVADGW